MFNPEIRSMCLDGTSHREKYFRNHILVCVIFAPIFGSTAARTDSGPFSSLPPNDLPPGGRTVTHFRHDRGNRSIG